MEVPLIGEPIALDLANTVVGTPAGAAQDMLATPADLDRWLHRQRERIAPPEGPVDLAALHGLRTHIGTAVEHVRQGTEPPAVALLALTDAQRSAPPYREPAWDGERLTVRVRRDADATRALLASFAESAVDLLADPRVRDIRTCAGPHCRTRFLPLHPRRQWCSAALCGNRARAARHYHRHKDRPPP